MKNHKNILILCLILVLCVGIFSACQPTQNENGNDIKSIEIKTKPKLYYKVNESIDLNGGEILVTYKNGNTKVLPFTDNNIKISHAGTGVADVTNVMRIEYMGKSVAMYYSVCGEKLIKNIKLEGTPETKYSVDGEIGLKDCKIVIEYVDDESNFIWLTNGNSGRYNKNYLKGKNIYLTGFNTDKESESTFNIRYLASEFNFNYEVVEEIWIKNVSVDDEDVIKKDYFIGEDLILNGAEFLIEFSDGSVKREKIKKTMVSGFLSDTAGEFNMQIKYPDFDKIMLIPYKIHSDENISSVVVKINGNEANVGIGDKVKFDKSILIINFNGGGHIEIPLISDDVELTCDGKPYLDVIKTNLGKKFVIDVKYKGHTTQFDFIVLNKIIGKELFMEDTIKTEYKFGEEFDFGDCYMVFTWNDGTSSKTTLTEQFALPVTSDDENQKCRSVTFGCDDEYDITDINMGVGEHSIWVSILTEDKQTNRYYIHYTVTE